MSKADSKTEAPAAVPAGPTKLREARLRAGEVHWSGARPITHVTTDRAQLGVLGAHVLLVDDLTLHPAGLLLKVDGGLWIIPHARVETYRLA